MPTSRKLPFQIYLSYTFIGLLFCFSAVFGTIYFQRLEQVILLQARANYELIGQFAAVKLESVYNETMEQTELLAQAMPVAGKTLDERLQNLPFMIKALENTKDSSSIQIGFGNGEFFRLQKIQSDQERQSFKVPDAAVWLVQNTTEQDGVRPMQVLSFNPQLQRLSRHFIRANDYDPRQRPWYQQAQHQREHAVVTDPYYFHFDQSIGITYSQKIRNSDAVVAIAIKLTSILAILEQQQVTPSSRLALIDQKNQVLAMKVGHRASFIPDIISAPDNTERLPRLEDQNTPVLHALLALPEQEKGHSQLIHALDENWSGFRRQISIPGGTPLTLMIASPHSELLAQVLELKKHSLFIFLICLLVAIAATLFLSRRVSQPLQKLAYEADRIARFDFEAPPKVESHIKEIAELSHAMAGMRATINSFLSIAGNLSSESHFDSLLARVLTELSSVCRADAGILYLFDSEQKSFHATLRYLHQAIEPCLEQIIATSDKHLLSTSCDPSSSITMLSREALQHTFPAIYTEDLATREQFYLLTIPLLDKSRQLVGAIVLLMEGEHIDSGRQAMAVAISGAAAIAIENQRLVLEQKNLLEAFIQLLAMAIDAKSPYTGGHCQRVPDLTKNLAKAACDEQEGSFANFKMSEAEWEELHIAAWLHDCGKVTTPEYVFDKATKLETLYDRIHEIRMRFEVLKRDAEIDYWQQLHAGGDATQLATQRDQLLATLDEEFQLIADCNLGGEFLSAEKIARIREIGKRRWTRSLSDRIGISHNELQRKLTTPEPKLPVQEYLLDDKPEHLIAREAQDRIAPGNPHHFKVDVPEYLYNRGELYNLSVARGTLSAEERYKINEHMIQTIRMLEQLPLPRHLRQVPHIAGSHHEKLNGTGYPRRLSAEEMGVKERIMAIADVFEALTASDRPYKTGKTLSESLNIMRFMVKDLHLDGDLFALFLRSGVYLDYARRYLKPEQIDTIQIADYL
ncbi:HD domain-containing phosphohydrolase [Undibacterium crateris]|uniref:HD domain-containing phosphohydrolase n=1 Tax=Undibacterium crateris TaxID=2528175 RepID=UPI001389C1AE|nr:HD domain-containing phosphohydrolase [Undibacterium crateris]NDI87103.1 HAMP domain-containing protein [Undibacterium crateris]